MRTGKRPRRGKIGLLSAFPAGLGCKEGDALPDLLAFALRTGNTALVMLGDAQDQRKFLITVPAFILVRGHVLPPFPCHWSPVKNDKSFCVILMNQDILSREDFGIILAPAGKAREPPVRNGLKPFPTMAYAIASLPL